MAYQTSLEGGTPTKEALKKNSGSVHLVWERVFSVMSAEGYQQKQTFWRLGASLLEDESYETFVLETWRFTFGGSLVPNARLGDLAQEVSYETLILETWRFTCGAGLRPGQFGAGLRSGQFVVHM